MFFMLVVHTTLTLACLVLVMWNVTVYIPLVECVVVLRLAVNIINNRCCKYTSYSAALWWTSTAKLGGGGGGGGSFEPPNPTGLKQQTPMVQFEQIG